MGAWGIQTFENDGALDWLGNFTDDPSQNRITDTFEPVVPKRRLLERLLGKPPFPPLDLDGEDVLAAAEVVATLLGKPSPNNPAELEKLPTIDLEPEISVRAVEAIDSVMRSSGPKECWQDDEERFKQWQADVADLRRRLVLAGESNVTGTPT